MTKTQWTVIVTNYQLRSVERAAVPLASSRTSVRPSTGSLDASHLGPSAWADWFGIVASLGCIVHCAVMPGFIAFLPTMGLSVLGGESFHQVMAVACSLLAVAAFVPGWRRHRRWLPIGVAGVGLLLINTAALAIRIDCCTPYVPPSETQSSAMASEEVPYESCAKACAGSDATKTCDVASPRVFASLTPFVTPLGGFLLISAHVTNRRYSCRCGCCPTELSK